VAFAYDRRGYEHPAHAITEMLTERCEHLLAIERTDRPGDVPVSFALVGLIRAIGVSVVEPELHAIASGVGRFGAYRTKFVPRDRHYTGPHGPPALILVVPLTDRALTDTGSLRTRSLLVLRYRPIYAPSQGGHDCRHPCGLIIATITAVVRSAGSR
jgi:hypothetical protein